MDATLCSSFIRTQWRFTLNDEHNIVLVFFAYFFVTFFSRAIWCSTCGSVKLLTVSLADRYVK